MSAIDGLPDFAPVSSLDDDESTVVAADSADEMEDITKPADDTDEANPTGAVARVAKSGHAVYNDMHHSIVGSPDGTLTGADRDTGGDGEPEVSWVLKNNMLTYRNPDPNGPEFLTVPLDPNGTELKLSGGTTVFIQPKPDGTYDVTITSVDPKVPKDGTDPHPGTMVKFKGLGSGKPFEAGKNPTGAETGGAEFARKWEETHDDGGKGGTMARLWVTPATAPPPDNAWSPGRRVQGTQKENAEFDKGQQPGGISMRSDRSYKVEMPGNNKKRLIWYDVPGVDMSNREAVDKMIRDLEKERKEVADPSSSMESMTMPDEDRARILKTLDGQIASLKGAKASEVAAAQEILKKSKAGEPLFDTPTNPDPEASIFGDGAVSGSGKPGGNGSKPEDDDDRDTRSSGGSRPSSGGVSLGDLFAAQVRSQLMNDPASRRREEARAAEARAAARA